MSFGSGGVQSPADCLQGGAFKLSGVIPAIKVIPAKQNAVVRLEAAPGPGGDGVALPLLTFYW